MSTEKSFDKSKRTFPSGMNAYCFKKGNRDPNKV